MIAMRLAASVVLVLAASVPASSARLDARQILAMTQRVADWQLSRLGQPVPDAPKETYEPLGWVNGALYVGFTALADRSFDPRYAEAVGKLGAAQNWQLGPRPFHADDQVIAQSWIWAYEKKLAPAMIAPTKARFDAVIAAAPDGTLDFGELAPGMEDACQKRWCWCDALFMAPPGWVELSRATGDPRYLAYADKEFWAAAGRLFSPEESLFYRDSRFMSRRGEHGEKLFWSRGNGWAYAGLARILQFLPVDAPERPRYVDLFRRMSARLVMLQKPDGYWPVSLLGPRDGTPPETSGTGFFTFGLAYGVASGLLADAKYRDAAERGWAALVKAVEPDGKLGWVQQIGAGPDVVSRDDTQLYGVGAFLLAGSAIYDLARQDQALRLVIHNPLSLPRTAARVEIPALLLPRGMTGDWVAVADGQIAPVQRVKKGVLTALDLPGQAQIPLVLRPRLGFDPDPVRNARATIPVKDGEVWREVPNFVVPPTHALHDPLFPIEGAGWESDRVGYRIYLDKRAINDIFGKKLPAPVLHRIGQGGPSYHDENDWGMDVWKVGDSLGAGGVGVLRGGMATQLGDMKRMTATVAASGPVLADLRVISEGWMLDGKPKSLAADFTIAAGSRLSLNTASASPGTPLVAGFGKFPDTVFIQSRRGAWGYIASWGRQSENGKDDVGVALFYPVAEIARTGDDGRSYFVVFRNPARARYAFAAAWAREPGGLPDEASFRAWLDRTAAELGHPVLVTAAK
jgi:rhamnogalacturonyl hydrolase YesR